MLLMCFSGGNNFRDKNRYFRLRLRIQESFQERSFVKRLLDYFNNFFFRRVCIIFCWRLLELSKSEIFLTGRWVVMNFLDFFFDSFDQIKIFYLFNSSVFQIIFVCAWLYKLVFIVFFWIKTLWRNKIAEFTKTFTRLNFLLSLFDLLKY